MGLKKLFLYVAGLITGIGVAVATVGGAAESIIPYSFKDGDVISADTLNDLFARVKEGNQGFSSESELMVGGGIWSCTTYDPAAPQNNFQAANFTNDSSSGLQKLVQLWNFSSAGTNLTMDQAKLGGISNNSTGVCSGQTSFSYSTRVVESALMATGNGTCTIGTGFVSPVTKVSPYKFRLIVEKTLVTCSATDLPPAIPSNVVAAVNTDGVTVAWTDNGGNATGFIVYKKMNGAYAEIGTTPVATTSYVDTGASAGALYRVASTRTAGTSLKSSAAIAK